MQRYTVFIIIFSLHGILVYASVLQNNIDLALRSRTAGPLLNRRTPLILFNNSQPANKSRVSPNIRKIIARTDTSTSNTPDFDETAFDTSVTAACANAVTNYASCVNPSGIVACYNIASWDNSTGVFQTDTRLYQKSAAVNEFSGLNMSDFSMSFSIPEAILSSPKMIANTSMDSSTPTPNRFLIGFQNVGQLSKSIQFSKLTTSDLRDLMIPAITLTANTGTMVNTSLASDMISYVTGQFVQANGTPTNITAPEANTMATAVAASVSVFVLPGTHIMVFPLGLIITCAWSGLLIAAVGAGTAGRYHHRMQYRRAQPGQSFAFGK